MTTATENSQPYYVILTGSKNNAGDYLIKYRAKQLFKALRPDREVIDINAWEQFDAARLNLVNGSKALILMGGPALQKDMYPRIYPLTANLEQITAPVVTMGIGWKSIDGSWSSSRSYPLAPHSRRLLDKVASSGIKSSVRDYHTLNALQHLGYDNYIMTGCPALNDIEHLKQPTLEQGPIAKVAFSLGVSFLDSRRMRSQMRDLILQLRNEYQKSEFEVVFHHSLDDKFLSTHAATGRHLAGHREFAGWLAQNGISYVDISGSAETLIEYYSAVDLHIGYRVHAHIFMTSVGKRSVLIAEDGRGKALRDVIGGLIIDGVDSVKSQLKHKVLAKYCGYDRYVSPSAIVTEVMRHIRYEMSQSYPRMRKSQVLLVDNFKTMAEFLQALP